MCQLSGDGGGGGSGSKKGPDASAEALRQMLAQHMVCVTINKIRYYAKQIISQYSMS